MPVILSVKALIYLEGLLLFGLLFFRWSLVDRMKKMVDARVFALTLVVPALLIFVPKLELAYAVLVVAGMLAPNRRELCAGYLLLLPMIPELSADYAISGVYLMRFSGPSALSVGAMLGLLWTQRRTRLHQARFDIAAAALVLLFTVINARGLEFTSYVRTFADNCFTWGVPYIIVSRSIGSEEDANSVLLRFYLAGALAAVIAIFEAGRHWALYEIMPSHLGLQMRDIAVLNVRAGFMRSGGPLLNPTAFALFLAMLPAGLWAIRSNFRRSGYWSVTCLLLVGLLATQSRGAWIACAIGYCGLWAYRGLRLRVLGGLAAALVLYVGASLVLPDSGRLAESLGRAGAAAGTGEYRRQLLDNGLLQVRAHPVFGQSSADLDRAMADMVQGQGIVDFVNSHLFVALGSGLIGFFVWVAIWGTAFMASVKKGAGITKKPATRIQLVPETMLVVAMVGLCFTSTAFRTLVWPIVALGMIGPLLSLARRPSSEKVRRPSRVLDHDGVIRQFASAAAAG